MASTALTGKIAVIGGGAKNLGSLISRTLAPMAPPSSSPTTATPPEPPPQQAPNARQTTTTVK
jgi:hypothetical protein